MVISYILLCHRSCVWNTGSLPSLSCGMWKLLEVVACEGKRATMFQELQKVVHNTDGVIRWMATGFFVVSVVLSVKL